MKTEEQYIQELESLNSEILDAEDEVRILKKQKQDLLIEQYIIRTGLKIGDVVIWREWGKQNGKHCDVEKKGRVVRFEVALDKVYPTVAIFKKDGTEGFNMRNYWDGITQLKKV